MALQGTIDGFGVVDVLQLLSASRKSGRLVIEGDRGVGQLFVRDGELTGGTIRGREVGDGVEIVFELLRFGEGAFLFEPGTTSDVEGFPAAGVPEVLREADARLEAWLAIEAVVPTAAHRLALEPELGVDEVTLSGAEWQVVVAAGAGASVAELAAQVGLDELAASTTVAGLVGRGLVRVVEPAVTADPTPVDAVPALPAASGPLAATDATVPDETAPDATVPAEPYMAAVLVTDDAPGAVDPFPEHFPIDDLLGEDDGTGWVTLEGDGSEDERFAAAQPFMDADDPVAGGQGVGFTHPAFADDPFAGHDDGSAAADPGSAGPGASQPAAFTDGAFSDGAFTDGAFTDGAFTEPSAFADPAFHEPGGVTAPTGAFDGGPAFDEPAGPTAVEADSWADRGAFGDRGTGAVAADGAVAATGTTPSTLAVQDPEVGAFTPAPAPPSSADTATDEVLKQMSRLSPKAAEAIAAALGSAAQDPDESSSDGGSFLTGL